MGIHFEINHTVYFCLDVLCFSIKKQFCETLIPRDKFSI